MADDGMGIAQMALLAGADDAGSTMMEENVVSASGTTKFSARNTITTFDSTCRIHPETTQQRL